jgi:hypothetical protein
MRDAKSVLPHACHFGAEGYGCPGGPFPMTAKTAVRIQANALAEDHDFRQIIREGSWDAVYGFVSGRLEEIKDILIRRLHVQLGYEYLMEPESMVYIGTPHGPRKVEDFFLRGKAALRVADYNQAVLCFESSARKVAGVDQVIANNYRAYSLARLGEPLRARLILSPLCKHPFTLPSIYWNMTCCMSSEEKAEQLALLIGGLYKSPHPNLLHGAIHLGTQLGHKLLAQWLLCLPLTEALLLAYYFQYDRMDSAKKENSILRLGAYAFYGEPEVPDPLTRMIPDYKVKKFVNALFKRQRHAEVVDFWLRCRNRIGRKRYDFWKIQADYLDQFGRRARALNAFRSELYCRMGLLISTPQLRTNIHFLSATRMRAGIYLRRCLSPELQQKGEAIYRMLARFEKFHKIRLLPNNARTEVFSNKNERRLFAEAMQSSGSRKTA